MSRLLYIILISLSTCSYGQKTFSFSGMNDSINSYMQFKDLFTNTNDVTLKMLIIVPKDSSKYSPVYSYRLGPFDSSIRVKKISNDSYSIYEHCSFIPCKNDELFKYDLVINDTIAELVFDKDFYSKAVIDTLDRSKILQQYKSYCNNIDFTTKDWSTTTNVTFRRALKLGIDITIIALSGDKEFIDLINEYRNKIWIINAGLWSEAFQTYELLIDRIKKQNNIITFKINLKE